MNLKLNSRRLIQLNIVIKSKKVMKKLETFKIKNVNIKIVFFSSFLDVTNQHSKDKNTHEPADCHEQDLEWIVYQGFRVLSDRHSRLYSKVEASNNK